MVAEAQVAETVPDLAGLARSRQFSELGKEKLFTELGTVGIDISGGRIRESRLQNFKGASRAKVIREMTETDAIVKGLLSNYTLLGRAAELTVSPGGDTADDEAAAKHIEECLDDMELPWGENVSAIFSMIPFGFSYHEVNYKRRLGGSPAPMIAEDGTEVPRPESKFDDGLIGWAGWPIRLQETIDRWDVDDHGRVRGAYQRAKSIQTQEVYIPLEKALHFRTTAKSGNPEGESTVESPYRAWYFKRNFEELLGIGVKRDLTGLLTMAVPKDWQIWSTTGIAKRTELEALLANLQRDEYEGLAHPDDVTPQLLSSGGQRQFDIQGLIRMLWLEIAISTLTDFALVGHEAIGARSLKEEAGRTFRIALQGFLDGIAETINRSAVPPIVRMNGWNVTAMPTVGFSTVDVPQVEQIIESLAKLANVGAEVFPNQEVTEAIFGMLRLPVAELEENLERTKGELLDDVDVDADIREDELEADITETVASPDVSLNGAQVKSLLEIVNQVADGAIPRSTGIEIIITAFNIERDQADQLMGEVGDGFEPAAKAPVIPFGGIPPVADDDEESGQEKDDEEQES